MSIEFVKWYEQRCDYSVDILLIFHIMIMKGDTWQGNVRYAEELLRVAAILVTHIMLASAGSK
jgi:hypothetical protein